LRSCGWSGSFRRSFLSNTPESPPMPRPPAFARSITLVAVAFLAALVPASELQAQTRLLREPTISATQIAFTYGADVWVVARSGGTARRITSTPAVEGDPHFSP